MADFESREMYLETIYVLSQKSSAVRGVDIGEYMGFSKPSVSRAVGLLKKEGFIETDKDNYITMTESGKQLAEKIYERHKVLSKLFEDIGVDKEVAAEDACRVEHYLSDETFDAIKEFVKKYEENK